MSWKEMKTNEKVLDDIGIKISLLESIKKRKLRFYGHIRRHNSLQKMMLEGAVRAVVAGAEEEQLGRAT